MKIYGVNNLNFGWNCQTHKKMIEKAIEDMPQFSKYKDVLADYVQRPDLDDIGFLANKHFYFGEKIKRDTFSKSKFENEPIEKSEDFAKESKPNALTRAFCKLFNVNGVSFMDYNGKNNAKAAFEEQVDLMDNAIEYEDDLAAIQSAGRACHFIQDMAQPQHTEETSAIGKAVDLKLHVEYENFAEENTDTFLNNFKKIVRNPRKSMQIFLDTFKNTRAMDEISKENKPEWQNMTQKQFDLAVQATKEFLQNVSDQMGLEYRDKKEDEIENQCENQSENQ